MMGKIGSIVFAFALSEAAPGAAEELAVPISFSLDAVSYFETPDSYSISTDTHGRSLVTIRFQDREFAVVYRKDQIVSATFNPSMWFQVQDFEVIRKNTIQVAALLSGDNRPEPVEIQLTVTYSDLDYPDGTRIENILIDYLWGVLICKDEAEKRICLPFHVLKNG